MSSDKVSPRENVIQVAKFVAFSLGAGIIQLVTFTILDKTTSFPYWPCYLTALVLSVLYNFTINRRFTFKSANNVPIAMLEVLGYYCVFTPLSTWLGEMAARANVNEYIVLVVTMLINMSTEFLFWRFVVYRNSINTNSIAKKERERALKEKNNQGDE